MGHKTEITIGLERQRMVRASEFLPGLTIHKAPDCPPGKDYLNISHIVTGLAIATHLCPGDVSKIRSILAKADWTLTPPELLESVVHRELYEEVMRITVRDKSIRQETRIARDTGGKRQPASGSRWGARRDVLLPRFLVEAKMTDRPTYYLDVADLAFLRKQAYSVGKTPVYIIEVAGKEEIVLLPFYDVTDETLTGGKVSKLYWVTKTRAAITANMALDALRGTVYQIELSVGLFMGIGYERFLTLAKQGVDADV